MARNLPPVMIEDVQFGALETDDERFEFAQYIVNTAPKDRPEISDANAKEALSWMESK
jgi:hypothetical protein